MDAPGKIPIRLPMIQDRPMVGAIRFISFLSRSILSLNFFAVPLAQIFFSARTSAWLMENKPIRAQVTLMPSYKEDCPNMKRCTPSIGSIPMVESRSPRAPEIRPFTIDLDDTPAMMVKPKMESQKYSGEPNFMASCAKIGAKK